ncbi:cupin domain-containing protein [Methylobacter luteus]|uniref:cupin domain-containing protein n=1 Tax=Methylobacter luteus TaxID=415 RepID=UPI000684F2CA|nr:AraC family ligand binding domain-containing protein [Methylobacter luteus]
MEFIELSPDDSNSTLEKLCIAEQLVYWNEHTTHNLPPKSRFGFVLSGKTEVQFDNGVTCTLPEHACFSFDQGATLKGGTGFLIELQGNSPLHLIGGPVEKWGRLKYIDGCTDTLLLPPSRLGEPCLNALYFPAGVTQTIHTHPSVRIGAVINGHGMCRTPSGNYSLRPGMLFVIPPNALHGFVTTTSAMTIVAYHPDSDSGPRDDDHPMINRTMVNGTSAKYLEAIRTS